MTHPFGAPFLTDVPLDVARARFEAALDAAGIVNARTETVSLGDALGRVVAEPVFARLSSPHYHACAMDGIAVCAASTNGTSDAVPRMLVLDRDAFIVDTGDPLPRGCDAVIMIEDCEPHDDGTVTIRAAVAPWSHVRAMGEDIVATEAVVPKRRRLTPADLGAIAAAGVEHVAVVALPRVAIVTTGDELVAPDVARPQAGQIVDSNGVLLAASVAEYGGCPVMFPRVADDPELLAGTIAAAIRDCDIVVVNAGSSAGRDDYTKAVFERFGAVFVHGVAIRPGHPVVLAVGASEARHVPLLGIPGYPVSAAMCAELFLKPLIERLAHREPLDAMSVDVTIARKIFSPLGEDEFVRVVAARVDGRIVAVPLRRGAGVITSLSRANAIVTISRFTEGLHAGSVVPARLLRGASSIERTLLAVGSHDVAIDLLAGALADRRIECVSANVGSIGGLVALAERSAHIAGTHVLDAENGTYNDTAVRRYAPDDDVALIAFARREQCLIVARGNPLHLGSLADVAASGARFVNRQRDAGTRMLLDAILGRDGIDETKINGYDRIEFTHLAVAALVADGSADCGLGIAAAALALDCDFIPVASEPYELAVLAASLDEPMMQALLEALREPALRAAIDDLGGYDTAHAGDVRFVTRAALPV